MENKFYDKYYQNMDENFIKWREITGISKVENIINICKGLKFKSVLEIGCGTGIILKILSERGFAERYCALDISESAVEYVKNQKIKGLIEVKKNDALEICYDDGNFDLAILSHLLEHLENPKGALLEAKRVANYIVIEVPLEDNIATRLKTLFFRLINFDKNDKSKNDIGHIYFFNKNKALHLVKSCGLKLEDYKVIHLSKKNLFFNCKSFYCKTKRYLFLILQSVSKITNIPLIRTHFIMLCKADDNRDIERAQPFPS